MCSKNILPQYQSISQLVQAITAKETNVTGQNNHQPSSTDIFFFGLFDTFDNSAYFGLLSCATATESRLLVRLSKSPPIHLFALLKLLACREEKVPQDGPSCASNSFLWQQERRQFSLVSFVSLT